MRVGQQRAWWGWLDPGEPHPARGPFTRWPRLTDGLLAVAVFGGCLIAVTASAADEGEDMTAAALADLPVGALAMSAGMAAALLWRRRRAMATAGVVLVILIAWAFAAYGDGTDLALAAAIYAVGRYAAATRHGVGVVVAAIAVGIFGSIIDANQRIDIAPAIILPWLAWYLGCLVRNRADYLVLLQERAERLEADQHAKALRAVADERSRIARELHDVVAHQVSMMTVQAGAAKTVARDDLDAAVDAMGDVERAGRQALGELRHLLGVLHPDPADTHLGPQPGLADIPSLANELRHTGVEVELTITPIPVELSAAIELAVYRIVQESFTNILKHAGPDPAASLTVGLDGDVVVVDVVNSVACTTTPVLPKSGYGIFGMRERAILLGGELTAESRPPSEFRVHARIPIEQERS